MGNWMVWVIGLTILASSNLWSYRHGISTEAGEAAKRQVAAVEAANTARDVKEKEQNRIIAELTRKNQERRTIYKTITKEVIKYAETNPAVECLNADGLRIVADIARGQSSAGEPVASGEVSTDAATTGGREQPRAP